MFEERGAADCGLRGSLGASDIAGASALSALASSSPGTTPKVKIANCVLED